jgi:hypothetical protein
MSICPICNKPIKNVLEHLRISHEIASPEEYQSQIGKIEKSKAHTRAFGDLVSQLKAQNVTGEQYRESVAKWLKEHPEE